MSKHGGHGAPPNPHHVYSFGFRRLTSAEKKILRGQHPGAKGHDYEANASGEIFAKGSKSHANPHHTHRPGFRPLTESEKEMMHKKMPGAKAHDYEVDESGEIFMKPELSPEFDIGKKKGRHHFPDKDGKDCDYESVNGKEKHHAQFAGGDRDQGHGKMTHKEKEKAHANTQGRRKLTKPEKEALRRHFPGRGFKGHNYEVDEAGETYRKGEHHPLNLGRNPQRVSCLACGDDAVSQCTRCKKAFYCKEECKHLDWEKKHFLECAVGKPADVRINNRWTGLFRDHASLFINWVNELQLECDPNTEKVQAQREIMTQQLHLLKDQADRRFSESVVDNYSDSLVKYATATLLHDAAATNSLNSLIGGQINEAARVFGVLQQQAGISRSDYESAWAAHIQGLVDYTTALKLGQPMLAEKAEETIQTSIRAGQTFWGRKWKEERS